MANIAESLVVSLGMTAPLGAVVLAGATWAERGLIRAETRETAIAFSANNCEPDKAPDSPQVDYAEQGYEVALGWINSILGVFRTFLSVLRPLYQFLPITGLTPVSQAYQGLRDTRGVIERYRRLTPELNVDVDAIGDLPADELDVSGFQSQTWDINMMCDEPVTTISSEGQNSKLAEFANAQITSQVDQQTGYLFSLVRGRGAQTWALAKSRLDIESGGLLTGVLGFLDQTGLSQCIDIPSYGESTAFMGEAENRCRGLVAGWLTGFIGF